MSDQSEVAKCRLIGAACMYGAGRAMLTQCAELGNYECFRRTMEDASLPAGESSPASKD